MKKVSIILPYYNAERYIRQCLKSILAQTYTNIEVLCVDNESTDKSLNVIKNFCYGENVETWPIFLNAPNLYKHSWEEPLYKAFEHMTGSYWTIIGADDIIEPDYIESCVNVIEKMGREDIIAIQSKIRWMGSNQYSGHDYANIEKFKQQYLHKCPVNTPSCFFKKVAKDYYIPSAERYLGAHDYFVYGHMANEGKMIYPVPFWLGYNYRTHLEQATYGMHEEIQKGNNFDKMIQNYWREKWQIN